MILSKRVKKQFSVLFLLAVTACSAHIAEEIKAPTRHREPVDYFEAVQILKNSSVEEIQRFDFSRFRRLFFLSRAGSLGDGISEELKKQFDRIIQDGSPDDRIKTADLILAKDFTDLRAHVIKAHALQQLGEKEKETYHR